MVILGGALASAVASQLGRTKFDPQIGQDPFNPAASHCPKACLG